MHVRIKQKIFNCSCIVLLFNIFPKSVYQISYFSVLYMRHKNIRYSLDLVLARSVVHRLLFLMALKNINCLSLLGYMFLNQSLMTNVDSVRLFVWIQIIWLCPALNLKYYKLWGVSPILLCNPKLVWIY